jgi:hypothetical protein
MSVQLDGCFGQERDSSLMLDLMPCVTHARLLAYELIPVEL